MGDRRRWLTVASTHSMKHNGGGATAFVLPAFTASCCKRIQRLGHVFKLNRRTMKETVLLYINKLFEN